MHNQVLAVTFLCLVFAVELHLASPCVEPDKSENLAENLYRQTLERFKNDIKYMVIPEYGDLIAEQVQRENELKFGDKLRELLDESKKRYQVKISGDTVCDSKRFHGRHRHRYSTNTTMNNLSTCPWHYVLDVDENRLPKTVTAAACTCNRCQSLKSGKSCPGHVCQEIVQKIPVVRRFCISGVYNYTSHIESVPIGCTCSRAFRLGSRVNIPVEDGF